MFCCLPALAQALNICHSGQLRAAYRLQYNVAVWRYWLRWFKVSSFRATVVAVFSFWVSPNFVRMHCSCSFSCRTTYPCAGSRTFISWSHTFYAVQNDLPLLNNVNDTGGGSEVLQIHLPGLSLQSTSFGRSVLFYRWFTRHLPAQHFLWLVCRTHPWLGNANTFVVSRLLLLPQRRFTQRLGLPSVYQNHPRRCSYL